MYLPMACKAGKELGGGEVKRLNMFTQGAGLIMFEEHYPMVRFHFGINYTGLLVLCTLWL
jgi:hypothetical protein